MNSWEDYLSANKERFLNELIEFLRIPSISSLPEHTGDVQRAAEWVAARLEAAGLEGIKIMPTGGHPVVYAEWLHAPEKPTVVIYGHFDIQPVDPLNEWDHPPFEPFITEERIYARGASDDKGNMLIPILAVEALSKSEGRLPVNVKFLFEGQEEIGSPQLEAFIESQRELLKCDLVLSADGGQWAEDQPVLLLGLRGLCALQVDLKGAAHDVHSGAYGGSFMNPICALARIIASLHAPDGRIAIEGFYDDVRPASDWEQAQIAALPYSDADFQQELGITGVFGEPGFSTYERRCLRPTVELNGIWGGFQGEGVKTVIPSQAHAKISCRLVPDQKPDKINELVRAHILKAAPAGVQVQVRVVESGADPYLIPHDHPGNRAASVVHKALYGKDPYYIRMGGSIPVCGLMLKLLGAYTVNFAFALDNENIHAPNEFFRLAAFERGQHAYARLLNELSKVDLIPQSGS